MNFETSDEILNEMLQSQGDSFKEILKERQEEYKNVEKVYDIIVRLNEENEYYGVVTYFIIDEIEKIGLRPYRLRDYLRVLKKEERIVEFRPDNYIPIEYFMILNRLGNKKAIAHKIIPYFPPHDCYIELFDILDKQSGV